MSKNNLAGKVAVVTGSTKGIGKALAESLSNEGASVVIVSRSQQDCDRVAQELGQTGAKTFARAADLTKLDDIQNLVSKTVERFGRIDILVNNAGVAITKKAEDITEEDWDRIVDTDLKAVFFCAQAVGKIMIAQGSGKIVNIASALGMIAEKMVLPYCAAKGGVIQVTKALALEWARYHIQVNALCPGYVMTQMNEKELKDEKIGGSLLKKIAMRRFADVKDMAGACLFLCSDASDYMTGQTLVIDGGWTCQ